jgi:PKHD-type hydroxylase
MRALYHWWEQALPAKQCDYLIEQCKSVPAQKGTTFNKNLTSKHRNSTIRWVQDLPGITDLIWRYIWGANRDSFNIDISAIFEAQFTEYDATEEQYYAWHQDVNWQQDSGYDRKLSIIIQLSDPEEYDGGDVQFNLFTPPEAFKKRGSVLVFPSYLEHQVTPVTRGTRYSLVSWIEGPRWR